MLLTMIMSLFSSILIGLAPCNSNCAALDQENTFEEKVKNNYVDTSAGYREYGTSDLFSYDFLVGLIDYYVNDLGVSDLSYNNTNVVNNYVVPTNNVYEVYYYDDSNKTYVINFNVSNIVMSKSIWGSHAGEDYPPLYYSFIFSNASPYDKQVHLRWFAQRTTSNVLTIWGIELGVIGLSPSDTIYWYPGFMLSENANTGYNAFIGNIFNKIRNDQYSIGFNTGYNNGLSVGYDNGYNDGKTDGIVEGKQIGDAEGYQRAISQGSTAATIFSGFVTVGLLPVNVLLTMFQYEVFGINIAGLVSGLFTIAVVIIIIRLVTGKKND